MNHFRLVRFLPDLSLGPSYIIGAMVSNGSQNQFIANGAISKQVPSAELDLAIHLQKLIGHHPGEVPHRSTNSMVRFDNPIEVPGDAADCVRQALFKAKREPAELRGERRATLGKKALINAVRGYGVKKDWIQRNFVPSMAQAKRRLPALPPVSQWVRGAQTLLLMEPVVTDRPTWKKDVAEINILLLGYQNALKDASERAVVPLVYVAGRRQVDVKAELGAMEVFDLREEGQHQPLANRITSVVRSPRAA